VIGASAGRGRSGLTFAAQRCRRADTEVVIAVTAPLIPTAPSWRGGAGHTPHVGVRAIKARGARGGRQPLLVAEVGSTFHDHARSRVVPWCPARAQQGQSALICLGTKTLAPHPDRSVHSRTGLGRNGVEATCQRENAT
jgi:hypothetical protein